MNKHCNLPRRAPQALLFSGRELREWTYYPCAPANLNGVQGCREIGTCRQGNMLRSLFHGRRMRGDATLQLFAPLPERMTVLKTRVSATSGGCGMDSGAESSTADYFLPRTILFLLASNPWESITAPRTPRGRGTRRREIAAVLQGNKNSRVEEIPW
jgi:hypothetical protein